MVRLQKTLQASLALGSCLIMVITTGCQTKPSTTQNFNTPAPETTQKTIEPKKETEVGQSLTPNARQQAAAQEATNARTVSAPTQEPAPVRVEKAPVRIPAGTVLKARLTNTVSTKQNRSGDPFTATLDTPVVVNGREVLPFGTLLKGVVVTSKRSGRIKGRSALSLQLTELVLKDGRTVPLASSTTSQAGKSNKKRNLALMGGGAGVGAAIGAIAGGKKGLAIGAPIGLGAGMATKAVVRGNEVTLPAETRLTFRLRQAVTIP